MIGPGSDKNALLEIGPKNLGLGRPPPPSFGQCPKENVFFHWCLPLWDKAVTHTGILPTFWNVTWLCWDQMNLSRHTMVTSRLDLNWLKLSTVWVSRRPFQLDPAVPLWFCQQVSVKKMYICLNSSSFDLKICFLNQSYWPCDLAGHLAWDNQDRIMLRFAAYFTQHNWRD